MADWNTASPSFDPQRVVESVARESTRLIDLAEVLSNECSTQRRSLLPAIMPRLQTWMAAAVRLVAAHRTGVDAAGAAGQLAAAERPLRESITQQCRLLGLDPAVVCPAVATRSADPSSSHAAVASPEQRAVSAKLAREYSALAFEQRSEVDRLLAMVGRSATTSPRCAELRDDARRLFDGWTEASRQHADVAAGRRDGVSIDHAVTESLWSHRCGLFDAVMRQLPKPAETSR
ncbi:hypothetical protein [Planctellipticum variicoloris]|uniref:hypothetical protein n=1 Tax=Planctellipticum variicoloris TaxID=3064265 RepID=UPI00301361F6|nr:hypothetical protein SH412_003279 [Planctomycetaceae bacterium SH412]